MPLMPPRFAIRAPVHGSRVALQAPSKPREASWDCVRNLVLKAETLGYDSVLITQHMINPNNDELEQLEAWSVAAALAALTRRIEIIAETHPRLIHPATLAKMALQIEDISHGRLAIKLACACDEGERHEAGFGPIQTDENDTYGREWMSILKPLLHGARVSYSGAHFDVQDYKLVPSDRYRPRPKIYFDGASKSARRLAAETADICVLDGLPLSDVKQHITDLSGRPRSGTPLRYGLSAFVIARPTDDAAEDVHRRLNAAAIGTLQRRSSASNVVAIAKFKQLRRFVGDKGGTAAGLVGSYETVAARILALWEAGIELFILQFHPFEAEMERFAHEVAPRIQARTSGPQLANAGSASAIVE